jgi:hypothetical protein
VDTNGMFTPLFKGALVAGVVASIFYFWILFRLVRAGVRVKYFATIFDTARMFRTYCEMAPSRGWPLWPIYGFWMAGGVMFTLGILGAPR